MKLHNSEHLTCDIPIPFPWNGGLFLRKISREVQFWHHQMFVYLLNGAAFSLFTSPKFFTFLLIIYFVIAFASFKRADATCRIFTFIQEHCDRVLWGAQVPH